LAGDIAQGVVLPGEVQGVKQGAGILIATDGTISVNASSVVGLVKLNNTLAFNGYVWPNVGGISGTTTFLSSDGTGVLSWSTTQGFPVVTVGPAAPTPPDVGELWYDTSTSTLKVYQTTVFPIGWTATAQPPGLGLVISGSSVKVSIPVQFGPPAPGTLPAESVDGSLYWDNNLGLLFIRYNDGTSTQWVQVVPSGGGGGGTYTGSSPIVVTGTAISLDIGLGNTTDGGFLKASTDVRNGPPAAGTGQLQAIDGSLYWDNNQGLLFIRYNDGTSTQWVQVIPSGGGGGGTGTVTSVGITGSGGITSVGGPITSSGVITVGFSLPALPVLP
jgi:hypothetical protein